MVDCDVVARRGDRLMVPLTVTPFDGLVSVAEGGVVSIRISWDLTGSALPALSNARYLTVVVAETLNGAV
jgi:hypothetical protein